MIAWTRFDLATVPPSPWKNGGGSTREIAYWPEGAASEKFDWRISVATIAKAGPFSVFAGIDRSITLLDGDGVALKSANGAVDHRLDTALVPFAFSGDELVDCALLGGESTDFNVMVRRATARANVTVLRAAGDIASSRHGLLMATHGAWALQPLSDPLHVPVPLKRHEGVWWADVAQRWRIEPLAPDSSMLFVTIDVDA